MIFQGLTSGKQLTNYKYCLHIYCHQYYFKYYIDRVDYLRLELKVLVSTLHLNFWWDCDGREGLEMADISHLMEFSGRQSSPPPPPPSSPPHSHHSLRGEAISWYESSDSEELIDIDIPSSESTQG